MTKDLLYLKHVDRLPYETLEFRNSST